jgi:hypothetical protein
MEYLEAIEAVVTIEEAKREIALHGANFDDFAAEYGRNDEYDGADVLGWLGY